MKATHIKVCFRFHLRFIAHTLCRLPHAVTFVQWVRRGPRRRLFPIIIESTTRTGVRGVGYVCTQRSERCVRLLCKRGVKKDEKIRKNNRGVHLGRTVCGPPNQLSVVSWQLRVLVCIFVAPLGGGTVGRLDTQPLSRALSRYFWLCPVGLEKKYLLYVENEWLFGLVQRFMFLQRLVWCAHDVCIWHSDSLIVYGNT